MTIDKQALRDIAEKTKIAGEAPVMPFEQRINALNDFMKHFTPATALALLDELEALQSFRTAYMEWSDKTDWVQTDKRLDVIKPWGKHRADVLKLYIDHLKSNLEAAEHTAAVDHEAVCSLVEENEELKHKLESAEKRIADYHRVLNNLAAVARRYLPDYDEHHDIQAADDLLESAAGIGKGA